ncbi:hypothetical protein [Dactylosporangium sp. NPDC000521]|uniref:hypothetical protein n=1 Tax=Dactylosporangium sp. NPDC000521 TaxID=3363975 RepID=UPI0036CAEDD4
MSSRHPRYIRENVSKGGCCWPLAPRSCSCWVIERNGKRNNSGKGSLAVKPERYVCEAQKLIQYGPGGDYTNELDRIG